jgi:hypothetical protein
MLAFETDCWDVHESLKSANLDFIIVRCKVRVFPLRVTRQLKRWPEKRQRQTQWHSPVQASRRVREAYLRQIIRGFAKQRKVER